MAPQKYAQEIGGAFDQRRIDFEHVPQDEIPGRVLPEATRLMEVLGGEQCIEIAAIEFIDDVGGERWEQFGEAEGQQPAVVPRLFQQIEGQARDVGRRSAQQHHQVGSLAGVPVLAKAQLVSVPKRAVTFERHYFEATLANAVDDTLFGEQLVRIGNHGQPRYRCDLGRKLRGGRVLAIRKGRSARSSAGVPLLDSQ